MMCCTRFGRVAYGSVMLFRASELRLPRVHLDLHIPVVILIQLCYLGVMPQILMNIDLDLPDHHTDKKKHPNFAINGPCPYVRGDSSQEKNGRMGHSLFNTRV